MAGHSKWANIKHRKSRQDEVRGKIATRLSREIIVAVRQGGADPALNMKLKLALTRARENNIPKDNIERAIQRGLGNTEGASYEEMTYEGYGPGGTAILIDVLTDNRNRTAADIRHLLNKHGGNMGETGCVSWQFRRCGQFVIENLPAERRDDLMLAVIEAGAEDFRVDDGSVEIITAASDFGAVQSVLEKEQVQVVSSRLTMLPTTEIELRGDAAEKMIRLLELLEEHDDVRDVFTNFVWTDD
ncbi:MAG: YebC/PmpR family DNA-binding transcriptional regulator [Negativicutes bacterium]|nr:YebC/PmpR family DNA-binding transcriptional regulator [Negativicutes bacterium]